MTGGSFGPVELLAILLTVMAGFSLLLLLFCG